MLILRKEAENDVKEAYDWYESQRKNLGRAFVAEIDRTLETIEEHPETHAQIFRSVRRSLCRRFPYAIYFVQRNSDVIVLAVLHQRRHPTSWLKRT